MFGTVLRFELRYHLRRPSTYLFFAMLFLMAFFFLASDAVTIGGGTGKVMKNSPFVLARVMGVLTAIGQVVTTALVGNAVLRDYQYGTHELLFTTRIRKVDYLGGRFAGVFLAMLLIYLAIPLGALIGPLMPWVDHDKLLPVSLASYVNPFLLLVVPSLFFVTALFFAVGALLRSQFAIYTQGIVLLVAWSISQQVLGNLDKDRLAALIDPFGLATFEYTTRYWTVAEKNAQLLPSGGILLANRLIWVGAALALLALTYALFRFDVRPRTLRRRKKAEERQATTAPAAVRLPAVTRRFDVGARARQLAGLARFSFFNIVKEKAFAAIAVIGVINTVMGAWFSDRLYDVTVWPATYLMVEVIQGGFILFFIILSTMYAGELAWRERQIGASQTADALPVPTGVTMTGKLLGLLLADALLLVVLMFAGIGVQAAKGYFDLQLGLYIRSLFGVVFPTLVQLALLAFLVHSVVNHKYVGHAVLIAYFVATQVLYTLGFEHQLWNYGMWASYTYSDMNGFGHFVPDLAWLAAYWTFFGVVLGVVAYLFWVRGTDTEWKRRLRAARLRWGWRARGVTGLGAVGALACGGFVFYNTNVLNVYRTSKEQKKLQASYETSYRRFRALPQPRLVDVKVRADLVPERRSFRIAGVQTFVNKTSRAIDTLFVDTDPDLTVDSLHWSRPARVVGGDTVVGVRLVRLASPLQPGDTLRLAYGIHYDARGFPNANPNNRIVANGTFLDVGVVPRLGYNRGKELADDDDRKKNGLPPRERANPLGDTAALRNNLFDLGADWITFDAAVSTAPDQIAMAPGYLEREWMENGRRVFHYRMDAPIQNFYAFLSARYAVRRDHWTAPDGRDIAIEVYYHPTHTYDIDRMVNGVKKALAYYTANFGPYQFRQVRILEFPRYSSFAQSFPNTIPFSEAIGFILRVKDEDDDLDMPFFVTAHEVAHQWWGHQVIGGDVQGSTMLDESLAEYSALLVMEHEYGRDRAKKFLRHELDRYLRGRSAERKKEMPLMLVENQPYIHYNKGSLAFYALRDYIGEERLNAALAKYLARVRFQQPPYTTSRELVDELRAVTPDSLQHVITDLFETITLFDFKATDATARRRPDGKYAVHLVLEARKLRADSLGNEKEIPLGDYVDVGVFGEREKGNSLGKPLYLRKVHVTQPTLTLDVVVDGPPRKAGIDPYNKLIDRGPGDNVRAVDVTGG
ncbi:MAG: ABC transporter permease subunit [Gemmatimonadetes bacterium]|nr:ABC transporter permease subunit [Gemmatimonadota bacterium]